MAQKLTLLRRAHNAVTRALSEIDTSRTGVTVVVSRLLYREIRRETLYSKRIGMVSAFHEEMTIAGVPFHVVTDSGATPLLSIATGVKL